MSFSDDDDSDLTPPEIKEEAKSIVDNLLPPKSKEKYLKAYEDFNKWKIDRKSKSLSENVFLAYFNHLIVLNKYKPTTLWVIYSMLKSTLIMKHDLNIGTYKKLTTLLKRQGEGYKCKSEVLSRENIENFLNSAPDSEYLSTKEVENIKEEFNSIFNEDEVDAPGRNYSINDNYEALRAENENLIYELEGYKNEAHLAKDEAERKFEKFKAQFIAQQALQNKGIPFTPPLPSSPRLYPPPPPGKVFKPQPPPPTPDDKKVITSGPPVPPTEAKLISLLTVFLMVHPLGASLDYLVSYIRSMVPNVTQASVHQVLRKYNDVFCCDSSGIGANIEHRWRYITFDLIKMEA